MKKLEEVLNIPHHNTVKDDDETIPVEADSSYNAITTEEKVDMSLGHVGSLDEHDSDMDKIAREALDAFEELKEFGMNSTEAHAGKILEVASQMLKTAMEAKNSKSKRKLDTVSLQLKKLKLEQDKKDKPPASDPEGGEFDRNELLAMLQKKD